MNLNLLVSEFGSAFAKPKLRVTKSNVLKAIPTFNTLTGAVIADCDA